MLAETFILLPLYLYPLPGLWDPLYNAARAHPNVTFTAVINPWDGPGPNNCPDPDYVNALATLNSIPNIKTLGYVHTANAWNCGASGTDICPCSQPLANLKANITRYASWPKTGCSKNNAKDIHLTGIFIDEAPSDGNCLAYMQNATSFAKSKMTKGNTVLFNAGMEVDSRYWNVADYINVYESTEQNYETADVGAMDGNGAHSRKTTMIITEHAGDALLHRDVNTILNMQHDAISGLFITDTEYDAFPSNWTGFVQEVAMVTALNKGIQW